MAVLNWWSHLSGSSRLCACSEKERERNRNRKRKKKEKNRLQLQPGLSGELFPITVTGVPPLEN